MSIHLHFGEELHGELGIEIDQAAQHNYDQHAQCFNVALIVHKVAAKILDLPTADEDHEWFRRMTRCACGSLQSVMLLCLAGRGSDAAKISRSVDEIWRTARRLRLNPGELESYRSNWWKQVVRLQEYTAIRERILTLSFSTNEEKLDVLRAGREAIDHVLGRARYYSKKNLFNDSDHDIYSFLSSYVHMDALALLTDEMGPDSDSSAMTPISLVLTSVGVIRLMEIDNEVGALGHDAEVEFAKTATTALLGLERFD